MSLSPEQHDWLNAGPQVFQPAPAECLADWDAIARSLGYGPVTGRSIAPHVREVAERMRARALEIIEPSVLWAPTAMSINRQVMDCTGPLEGRMAVGDIVSAQLRRAEMAVVFVVSIGDELERESRAMLSGPEVFDGFVLDAVGSVAADACADVLEARLRDQLAPLGWRLTNRFSPGYCSWETADQKALFGMLPEKPAGVTLSDSALMHPIKSVSGVIGVGANVEHQPYPCAFCAMESCHQRLVESRI